MNVLFNLVVAVQVLSALVIIALVLLQHGKGADMGAAFGSGASGSLFGATGSSNFMSKSTGVAAAIFFSATLGLSYMANQRSTTVGGGVMERVTAPIAPTTGSAAIPTTAPAPAPAPSVPAAGASAPASSAPAAQIPK
ncbi:MAG TPA: preprotein translocase subunit SecG [Janthinobacterium sp.]|nr:preprotein translocase subunit SecG [Janthinobacterium sp.]